MYHGDRGAGAKPNFRTREAMSTSDVRSGSEITTARPPVACNFIEEARYDLADE